MEVLAGSNLRGFSGGPHFGNYESEEFIRYVEIRRGFSTGN